jgi:hypothetical protein
MECCHFTADMWWRWNVIASLRMRGGTGVLSLHCGYMMAVECHFAADVRWHWNVFTSLRISGGAGMLSLHSGCLVVLECYLSLHCGSAVALQHVPPIPLSPNTFFGRLRIVIGKRLRKFEYRPEVCGATNGST